MTSSRKLLSTAVFIMAAALSLPAAWAEGPREEVPGRNTERRGGAPKIQICSWNIYRLNESRHARVLSDISDIIKRNQCDIISIQEVLSQVPIDKIQTNLNTPPPGGAPVPQYRKLTSQPTGSEDEGTQQESYTLLWREDKIVYVQAGGLVSHSQMGRSPHVARFRAAQGGTNAFDFMLMSIHTKTGSELRGDIHSLRRDYDYVKKQNPQEPDIIVVGDFNLAPSTSPVSIWQAHLGDLHWSHTNPPHSSMAGNDILNDNLVWGPPTQPDYTGERGLDVFEAAFDNGPSNKRISDHRPLWARFWANQDND